MARTSDLSAIEFKGWIYVLGGSNGDDVAVGGQGRELFNDVWRSRDGAKWELVTMQAGWSARPGHVCQVLSDTEICFGGFGFPFGDPTVAAHPVDMWASRDGATWSKLPIAPWNAADPAAVKYDFDSLVVRGGGDGRGPAIYTFGGDREASFIAPNPGLVDDEVWRFTQPARSAGS